MIIMRFCRRVATKFLAITLFIHVVVPVSIAITREEFWEPLPTNVSMEYTLEEEEEEFGQRQFHYKMLPAGHELNGAACLPGICFNLIKVNF